MYRRGLTQAGSRESTFPNLATSGLERREGLRDDMKGVRDAGRKSRPLVRRRQATMLGAQRGWAWPVCGARVSGRRQRRVWMSVMTRKQRELSRTRAEEKPELEGGLWGAAPPGGGRAVPRRGQEATAPARVQHETEIARTALDQKGLFLVRPSTAAL